jgi:hypothetical protein
MCPRRDCALPGALPRHARAALSQQVSRVTRGLVGYSKYLICLRLPWA